MSTPSLGADAPAAPADPSPVESTPGDNAVFGESLDAFFTQLDSGDVTEGAVEAAPSSSTPESPTETARETTPNSADPLDEVDELKDWTPQAARRFKELKAENKQAKTFAQELEAAAAQRETRIRELEAIANDPKVKNITERAGEYEHAMLLTDLERSPAYKQLVVEPLSRITSEIDALAAKYAVSGDDLIDVVVMEDEAEQEERLGELLVNASDRDKFRLYKLIEETKPVLEQRAVLHENAQEALTEIRELEQQQQALDLADRAKHRSAAASEVVKRIEAKLPFLATFDGVDLKAMAKQVGEIDYSQLEPAVGTYQALAGRLLPKLASQYLAARREIGALTDKLAEYDRSGSPLKGGGGGGPSQGSSSTRETSFMDAVEAAFR